MHRHFSENTQLIIMKDCLPLSVIKETQINTTHVDTIDPHPIGKNLKV